MQKAVSPRSMAQNVELPTINVTHLNSLELCSTRGVQLPPLAAKGQLLPEQVTNARFRLVEVDPQPLSDQQFNALIKRLVKCFMSEVEITKRLRKVTSSRQSVHSADVELIRHLEALRRTYETERSGLVVRLSRDCRFRFYASHTPQSAEKRSDKSCRVRKSRSMEILSKSSEVPAKAAGGEHERDVRPSRQRQTGGFQTIVCNRIATPAGLSKRLRAKLYRLQEISKSPKDLSIGVESLQDSQAALTTAVKDKDSPAESSSTESFYDILEMEDV